MHDVIAALKRHAAVQSETVAFSDPVQTLTWRQLCRRVAGMAETLPKSPKKIGLLAESGVDWAVCDLAAVAAGRTLAPLPTVFSDGQLRHIVQTAEIETVLVDEANAARMRGLAPEIRVIGREEADVLSAQADRARRVIFTSGSTGAPKGVILGDRQLNTMVHSLADAIAAQPADRYLSVLPLALLLEQLCAIHVPVLVGGRTDFAPQVSAKVQAGNAASLMAAADHHRPSVTVLVPELLRAWVGALRTTGSRAPQSLRFVAVGGAPVPEALADAGWALGIPVHEGYGLSECASVVTLNRAGGRKAGTVGAPLAGVGVAIDEGEVVVDGPTVMDGYLGGKPLQGRIRTGDLGHFDEDGKLVIEGRRDNLLVMAGGRNVQAEWVEGALMSDPRIALAVVVGHGAPRLTAVIVPTPGATAAFSDPDNALAAVRAACSDLPAYAVPGQVVVSDLAALAAANQLTPSGRPCRRALAEKYARPIAVGEDEKERIAL